MLFSSSFSSSSIDRIGTKALILDADDDDDDDDDVKSAAFHVLMILTSITSNNTFQQATQWVNMFAYWSELLIFSQDWICRSIYSEKAMEKVSMEGGAISISHTFFELIDNE